MEVGEHSKYVLTLSPFTDNISPSPLQSKAGVWAWFMTHWPSSLPLTSGPANVVLNMLVALVRIKVPISSRIT